MATQPELAQPQGARETYAATALSYAARPFLWYWTFTKRKPLGGIGLVLIVILALVALTGPWLVHEVMGRDELKIHSKAIFHKPDWSFGEGKFFLGADHLGRDVLGRLIIGARTSLLIAVISISLGNTLGWLLGLVSGFKGGWVDMLIQRLVDMKMAIPGLILALAIVAVLGRDPRFIILAIALNTWTGDARITRSVVLSIKNMEYVQAARALGASEMRIMLRHVAPQTFAPFMILYTAGIGGAILIESSLSFLGLGTAPPKPSWGSMLSGPTLANVERAPWNAVWPGLALSITVYSFNLLGDALRDVLDPRLRGFGR